jgi:hypothetical protein
LATERKGGHVTVTIDHWTNERTTIEWIDEILVPYLRSVGGGLGTICVVILDVWWGQTDQRWRDHLASYDWIKLLFVPASCTSKLQVCDLALNNPFNDAVRDAFCDDVIEIVDAATDKASAEGRDVIKTEDDAMRQILSIVELRNRNPGYVSHGLKAAYESGMCFGENAIFRAWAKAGWVRAWKRGAAGDAFYAEAKAQVDRLFKSTTLQDAPDDDEMIDIDDEENSWEAFNKRLGKHLEERTEFLNTVPAPKKSAGGRQRKGAGGGAAAKDDGTARPRGGARRSKSTTRRTRTPTTSSAVRRRTPWTTCASTTTRRATPTRRRRMTKVRRTMPRRTARRQGAETAAVATMGQRAGRNARRPPSARDLWPRSQKARARYSRRGCTCARRSRGVTNCYGRGGRLAAAAAAAAAVAGLTYTVLSRDNIEFYKSPPGTDVALRFRKRQMTCMPPKSRK